MTSAPPLLLQAIKEAIARGDRAKERAENFYITAGQHLKNLKDNFTTGWADWEETLRVRLKLSTGRASELMQIGDGRKTVAGLRANDAEKHRRLRSTSQRPSSGRPEENGTPAEPEYPARIEAPTPTIALAQDGHAQANELIDALTASSSATRNVAASLLISGSRQSAFAPAVNAVADLYQTLARSGR